MDHSILSHPQQCVIFFKHLPFSDFSILAILVGVKWHVIEVLIQISLMITDAESLSMCLSIVYLPWRKRVFSSSAHFKIWLFGFLLLSCKCSLYILDISSSDIWFWNLFLFETWASSFSWWCPLKRKCILILMKASSSSFCFWLLTFLVLHLRILWQIKNHDDLPMFSSKSFRF